MQTKIWIVEDDEDAAAGYRTVLSQAGYPDVLCCGSAAEARETLQELSAKGGGSGVGLVFLDLNLGGDSGEELLPRIRSCLPGVPVVVITGSIDAQTAVSCMKAGASDYLTKPFDPERFLAAAQNALARSIGSEPPPPEPGSAGESARHPAFARFVTVSPAMELVFSYAATIATSPKPALITGENGTGKELLAKAIHDAGGSRRPWVTVNVAGLDDHAFSDTLFGHKRGAFTGANASRAGLVEEAAGGTLLLDEIGDLRPESQVKLLRLLQENEYRPLGEDKPRECKARILATTNRDLPEAIAEGDFRADLFYRLRFHHLHIPALRERPCDIAPLARHFLDKAAASAGLSPAKLPESAIALLEKHPFPGNARELEALLYDAAMRFPGREIPPGFFRFSGAEAQEPVGRPHFAAGGGAPAEVSAGGSFCGWSILPTLADARKMLIEEALRRSGGKQAAAARMLGITPQALSKHLRSAHRP